MRMRILALFTVLGLIRKREQVAGNRKGSEEQDQMFYVLFFSSDISEEKNKLKKNKPRLQKFLLELCDRKLMSRVSPCVSGNLGCHIQKLQVKCIELLV